MRSHHLRRASFYLAGVLFLAGLVWTTARVQPYRYRPYLHETLYLPSGKFVRQLALDYKQIAADMVWLSAIQYYGDYRQGNHSLAYFKGLIDIVTTLDPHFIFAYVFGALVVSEDVGNLQTGVDILKGGMAQNPSCWRLPFEIGFLSYVNQVDFELAGRYLNLAARMPDAPEYVQRFAAFAYSRADRHGSAVRLWEEYMDYTDDPLLKELAGHYIDKIKHGMPLRGHPEEND
ncbi:MAG: hypothetical protein ACE5EO_01925 [Candidatus Krumholzibacteriia bacterium]